MFGDTRQDKTVPIPISICFISLTAQQKLGAKECFTAGILEQCLCSWWPLPSHSTFSKGSGQLRILFLGTGFYLLFVGTSRNATLDIKDS